MKNVGFRVQEKCHPPQSSLKGGSGFIVEIK
jgi:hypothetical protein